MRQFERPVESVVDVRVRADAEQVIHCGGEVPGGD